MTNLAEHNDAYPPSLRYIRKLFCEDENPIQIIIPRKRIQFIKDGDKLENKCNFDCFYYCWKIGLNRDIIWLKNEGEE
jgi:hypothetical protein